MRIYCNQEVEELLKLKGIDMDKFQCTTTVKLKLIDGTDDLSIYKLEGLNLNKFNKDALLNTSNYDLIYNSNKIDLEEENFKYDFADEHIKYEIMMLNPKFKEFKFDEYDRILSCYLYTNDDRYVKLFYYYDENKTEIHKLSNLDINEDIEDEEDIKYFTTYITETDDEGNIINEKVIDEKDSKQYITELKRTYKELGPRTFVEEEYFTNNKKERKLNYIYTSDDKSYRCLTYVYDEESEKYELFDCHFHIEEEAYEVDMTINKIF